MHIPESGMVVAKGLQLILLGIAPASGAQIHLTQVVEIMALVLGVIRSQWIMKQQNMMTLVFVQLDQLVSPSGPFHMIAGIMVHEFDLVAMQLFANIRIIAVQPVKVIGKVKADVKPEIDGCVDAGLGKGLCPALDPVHDLFLRPEQILQLAPPAGGPHGNKGEGGAFRLNPARLMGLR